MPAPPPCGPPTGITLAAFLLLGKRVWPGVVLGAFLANITTTGSVATSIAIALGNTLEGLLGAYLTNRFASGRHSFETTHDVFIFVFLVALLSTMLSATLGVTSLCLGGFANWANYGPIWLTWWLGDAVGALVVTPPLVLWSVASRLRWSPRHVLEAVALLLALLLVGWAVFGAPVLPDIKRYPLTFFCIPLLIWAALRFGQREATTVTCGLSALAIWGTMHGVGPFVTAGPNESLLLLQAFIAVASVTSLILAAAVRERRQAEVALRQAKAELERRVAERTAALHATNTRLQSELSQHRRTEVANHESQARLAGILDIAEDAIIAVNEQQQIALFNQGAARIFGYSEGEVIGQPLDLLLPAPLAATHHRHIGDFAASPKAARKMGERRDIFGRRRDGTEFPAEASISKLTINGKTTFTAFLRDITERKQAEMHLRASVREKEILLQEVHHRVKNNLQIIQSLLRLQAYSVDNPALHELLLDSQNRVYAMALVHEQLYRAQDLAHVNCAAYLCELATSVLRSYEAQSLQIRLTCAIDHELAVDIDTAIPLGLILTELVSNSLKHAFPDGRTGTVTVGLQTHAKTLIVAVCDDGVGLPATVAPQTAGSLGLQLVGDLTEQLGGTISIDRQLGTSFHITIPHLHAGVA